MIKYIFVAIILSTFMLNVCFSQEEHEFYLNGYVVESACNLGVISNMSKINEYFSNIHNDYKDVSFTTLGLAHTEGFRFHDDKFAGLIDLGVNYMDKNEKKEQFKRLLSFTTALSLEYLYFENKYYFLSIKSGYRLDFTRFSYTRMETENSSDIYAKTRSYSYINGYVPITLGIIFKQSKSQYLGIYLQYNIFTNNFKTSYSGTNIKANDGVPIVTQNNLLIGFRWSIN